MMSITKLKRTVFCKATKLKAQFSVFFFPVGFLLYYFNLCCRCVSFEMLDGDAHVPRLLDGVVIPDKVCQL
jgi:hypothetical protein